MLSVWVGQIDLEPKPSGLVSIVNSRIENAALQSKKQVLDLQFSPELPPALCDEDWTKQIVTNLLKNAVKLTPESGHISIRVRLADQPGFLQLSVLIRLREFRNRNVLKYSPACSKARAPPLKPARVRAGGCTLRAHWSNSMVVQSGSILSRTWAAYFTLPSQLHRK
jgi:hypothetical protein